MFKILFVHHFHRTTQPISHFRKRKAFLQRVWTAHLFSPWFYSLYTERLRIWEEGWCCLPFAIWRLDWNGFTHVSLGQQLEFIRKRYHKDIMSNPVLMLNFCPDLLCEPLELHKSTREVVFLVDRSGSMSGTNIQRVKVSPKNRKACT